MAIHSKNESLMCKVFPSSLNPTAMRWFDGLKEDSIKSYEELMRAFSARLSPIAGFVRFPAFYSYEGGKVLENLFG